MVRLLKTVFLAGDVPAENPHHSSLLSDPSQKEPDEIEMALSCSFNDCCGHGSGEYLCCFAYFEHFG